MTEESTSGVRHSDVAYCPFCGRDGSTLKAWGDAVLFDCESHGVFTVTVRNATPLEENEDID